MSKNIENVIDSYTTCRHAKEFSSDKNRHKDVLMKIKVDGNIIQDLKKK